MPFAPINEIDVYYEVHGQGTPIVFLSGFSTHHLTWQPFIQSFEAEFQLILIDNRGAGQTTSSPGQYTIEMMADDTVALMDYLQLEKAHMVGSSMGTAIIQMIAHRYPKHLMKGALIAPFSKLPRTSLLKSITTGKLLQSGVDMELVLESVIPWLFSRDFVSNPHQVAAKKEEMMKNPYPQSINGFIGQINALETFDSTSFLSSIPHPLLLLAGEEDLSTPPWCAKLLHNHLPHSTLHFFPRMGHMAHVEKRDEVIALINSFF